MSDVSAILIALNRVDETIEDKLDDIHVTSFFIFITNVQTIDE